MNNDNTPPRSHGGIRLLMRLAVSVLLLIMTLSVSSCDLFMENHDIDRKMYVVGIGLNYRYWNGRKESSIGRSYLKNTENDLNGMISQMEHLIQENGMDYRIVTYDDFSSMPGNGSVPDYRFKLSAWGNEDPQKDVSYYSDIDISTVELEPEQFAKDFCRELKLKLTDNGNDIPDQDDILILYFSGHGLKNGLGPAVYYQTNMPTLKANPCAGMPINGNHYIMPLPYTYIKQFLLDAYPSNEVILYDCCYSGKAIEESELNEIDSFKDHEWSNGTITQELIAPSLASMFDKEPEKLSKKLQIQKGIGRNNRFYITASHENQMSFDVDFDPVGPNQRNYGAFTYQILSYLDFDFLEDGFGKPGDHRKDVYSVSDMYRYVYDNIGDYTRIMATPDVTRNRYDFAFIMF